MGKSNGLWIGFLLLLAVWSFSNCSSDDSDEVMDSECYEGIVEGYDDRLVFVRVTKSPAPEEARGELPREINIVHFWKSDMPQREFNVGDVFRFYIIDCIKLSDPLISTNRTAHFLCKVSTRKPQNK